MALIIASLFFTAAPALACEPITHCNVEKIVGAIPCAELRAERDSCYIELKQLCGADNAATVILDERQNLQFYYDFTKTYITFIYEGPENTLMTVQWQYADKAGQVHIYVKSEYGDGCDPVCAAASPQRPAPAPLIALLPLALGALVARRRRAQ